MSDTPKKVPQGRKWKPGESGNPKGKPPGSGPVQKLRAAIGEQLPQIMEAMTRKALEGDVGAARLLLERVVPALRPVEPALALSLPDGTLTEQGRAVMSAIGAGELAPGQGAALLGAISSLGKLIELDELDARVKRLEEQRK